MSDDWTEREERERLRVERELVRQDDRRLRALKLTGVAVFVVGVGALVALAVTVTGKGGSESTQARPVSQGPAHPRATLTVYEDLRCSGCRRFEERYGGTVEQLRRSGKLKTERHLVTHVDATAGGEGSHRAAEAALCALDEHRFDPYRKLLYDRQPPRDDDAFASDEHLLRLAGGVEGLTGREFEKCVRHGLQSGRVERLNAAYEESALPAPPVVLLNGERLDVGTGAGSLTPDRLREAVERKGH